MSKNEVINKRKSVRTYEDKQINDLIYKEINSYLEDEKNFEGPFDEKISLKLIPVSKNHTENGQKIGTYGFIKNPQAYIVGICENKRNSLLQLGYVLENMIINLTAIGIGTCWLGGTFTRNSFEEEIKLNQNQIIPVVTPIGYEKTNKGLVDKFVRFAAKSNSRKEFGELFFKNEFNNPLGKEGIYKIPLEMVKVAPSASNKQPWRAIIDKLDNVHFYIAHTENYAGNKMGFDMQLIDIGIAISHFQMGLEEIGIK